jgi:hypothetical protein
MGVVKHYQMEIAELGGHAHANFWGKHNRAPDTDDPRRRGRANAHG